MARKLKPERGGFQHRDQIHRVLSAKDVQDAKQVEEEQPQKIFVITKVSAAKTNKVSVPKNDSQIVRQKEHENAPADGNPMPKNNLDADSINKTIRQTHEKLSEQDRLFA